MENFISCIACELLIRCASIFSHGSHVLPTFLYGSFLKVFMMSSYTISFATATVDHFYRPPIERFAVFVLRFVERLPVRCCSL